MDDIENVALRNVTNEMLLMNSIFQSQVNHQVMLTIINLLVSRTENSNFKEKHYSKSIYIKDRFNTKKSLA